MKKKSSFQKGLVVGIIVLFIGLAVIPSTAISNIFNTILDNPIEKLTGLSNLYEEENDCGQSMIRSEFEENHNGKH